MKKFYTLVIAALLVSICGTANAAQWEQIKSLEVPYCAFVTKSGNLLLADYQYDGSGGIYISEDKGETWTKTEAPDYCYEEFIQADDYIIALGMSARLARSNDEGRTWEILNYSSVVSEYLGEKEIAGTVCYAAGMHKGKLFVGDYSGGGIFYSEDYGETWNKTDIESLKYEIEDKSGKATETVENIYAFMSYKDELYVFAAFHIYKYDEANNSWITLLENTNFAVVTAFFQDQIAIGRSIMDENPENPFIMMFDGENWSELPHPAGLIDNNVRTMYAEDDNIYVGMQQTGFYYSTDKGQNWLSASEGLPGRNMGGRDYYHTLLSLTADEDYLYMVVYYFDETAGLYRLSKNDLLPTTSIESVSQEADNVYVDQNTLRAEGSDALYIYDLGGREVNVSVNGGSADISKFENGVYIYRAVFGGNSVVGKFVK